MASPQKKDGYIGIANEIWDEIIRRNFTKRQLDILLLILRLSYGCNRKVALIPKQKDFYLCGIGENHIKDEIKFLIQCKVLNKGIEKGEYLFNKNYEQWQITPVLKWDTERFKELIHINLKKAKKKDKKLPETGTSYDDKDNKKTSQKGNLDKDEKLPKKGTFENENFPKREDELPKKGSLGADEAIQDKDFKPSKKGLKNKDIKKVNIYTCVFEDFWGIYPRKIKKKETFEIWKRVLKNNVHSDLLISCAKNYDAYCKKYVEEDIYVMHPSTFLNKERYLDYEKPMELKTKQEYKNLNEDELQKRLEEKDREAERNL